MEKLPITNKGFEKLETELKLLKSTERPNVIKAIAEAREHGDLSENAEYHAAKEKQSFIEGRIADLENKISRAEVINTRVLSGNKIIFGATVTLGEVGKKKLGKIEKKLYLISIILYSKSSWERIPRTWFLLPVLLSNNAQAIFFFIYTI